jgi:hypothetical protein
MGGGAAMAELKLHDRCGSSPRGRGVGEEEGCHGCEEEEKEMEEREKKKGKENEKKKWKNFPNLEISLEKIKYNL